MPAKKRAFVRRLGSSVELMSISVASYLPFNLLRIAVLRLWGAEIGRGVAVCHGLVVRKARSLKIGNDVYIAEGVSLDARGGLDIASHVSINAGVQIWTAQHDWRDNDFKYVSGSVKVGDRAWLSARSVVLPNTVVEDGVVLAAGSVAKGVLSCWGLYAGMPARRVADRPDGMAYNLDAAKNKPFWW